MKNLNRQHVLLAVLAAMGLFQGGDYVLSSMIQGPLAELRGDNADLQESIDKKKQLLAESRSAGQKIEAWKKKSLPTNTEEARSLYRNWLVDLIRSAKLTSASVDPGSARNRGKCRTIPFTVRARGRLDQIVNALFRFENTNQLHRIVSLRLSPVSNSGQFDLTLSIEALIVPGSKRKSVNTGKASVLAFADRSDYDVISRDNIFGIGIDRKDPMQLTILSAVTSRNGEAMAWITEQIANKVHQLPAGAEFDTVAMTGKIVSVDENSVVIESGEQQLTLAIGQSFAEAQSAATP